MSYSRGFRRFLALLFAVLVASLLAGNSPATATGQGSYVVSRQDGKTFQLLTKNNLLLGTTDDGLFRLKTTLRGVNHLPFPVTVYGQKFGSMTVSANGDIQFGVCCSGGVAGDFSNQPLPTSVFPKATLAVFWDDLFFSPDDTTHYFKEGIFTKTSGRAPHRTFLISWQGHSFSSEQYYALAQVLFTERSQTIKFIYGVSDQQSTFTPSETIGVQGAGGTVAPFTSVTYNSPATVQGRQYTFQHVG